jgi:hypothetical protein
MSISTPTPTPNPSFPDFDQVVEGNVDIKQLSKKKYKITFNKIGKFLKYQTWSDSSKTLNENRSVYYQKAKLWVQDFNKLNASLKASDKPLFKPTTVMEIGNNKYLFVLDKAKLNRKGQVIFKVSTKEINSSDKKMLKLPRGHHDGVRFDIDENANATDNICWMVKNSNNFSLLNTILPIPIVEIALGSGWSSFKLYSDLNQGIFTTPFLINPFKSKFLKIDYPNTYSFLKCGANPPLWLNTNNLEDLRTLPGDNLFLYNYVTTYLQVFPSMQNYNIENP